MGRVQKLREQKKQEAALKEEQKTAKNKKIITWTLVGLVVLVIVIYGSVNIFSKRNKVISNSNTTPNSTPTQNKPGSLFPSLAPISNQQKLNQPAIIETTKGEIKLELYPEAAPKTVANFIDLTSKGFYNGLEFHRVVPGFVIQGGDPKGDGTGGPGYTFEDEINPKSLGLSEATIKSYEAQGYKYNYSLNSYKMEVGVLAMANSGPNTNGSQFFIVTEQDQPHLDGKHTVFGRVVEGMDVVRKIQQGDIIKQITINNKQ
jgi:peptidyl-prolyl cis-trans isomerase B (cyclophilin B)